MESSSAVSIIVPVYNEAGAIGRVVGELKRELGSSGRPYEIIVVDDGCTDESAAVARQAGADKVCRNPIRQGYGLAIRTGLAAAQHEIVALIDGDGSYAPADLCAVLALADSHDMAVGLRRGALCRETPGKRLSRKCLVALCEFVSGAKIPDINSGMRVFRRSDARLFLGELSYGFSFTTSLTLCLLLNGFLVGYVPVDYRARIGKSKVRRLRDSLRTLQIVFEACARYNPLKLFLLLIAAAGAAACSGIFLWSIGWGSFHMWLLAAFGAAVVFVLGGLAILAAMLVSRKGRARSKWRSDRLSRTEAN